MVMAIMFLKKSNKKTEKQLSSEFGHNKSVKQTSLFSEAKLGHD
jgi:hypothetical protein